jgi:hypothetical protein
VPKINIKSRSGENLETAIDSTGLKVYGEWEWKVRKHGWSKHRTWRKLHVCIDLASQEILSVELTGNEEDDASAAGLFDSAQWGGGIHKQTRLEIMERTNRLPSTKSERSSNVPVQDDFRRRIRCPNIKKSENGGQTQMFDIK